MTVDTALAAGTRALGMLSTAQLDSEVLLAYALGQNRTWILSHGDSVVPRDSYEHFHDLLGSRADGRPVAYLIGQKEFRGRPFTVDQSVLIPRPESELLVELALERIQSGDSMVDVGTGSGCLGLTVAAERPDVDVHLVDISAVALSRAAENAARLGLAHVRLHRADLWPEVGLDQARTVVIANLPYVPDGVTDHERALRHEPSGALYGGADGLDVIRRFLNELTRRRFYPRTILLEHGHNQAEAIAELTAIPPTLHKDLASKPRVTELTAAHLKAPSE